MKNQTYPQLHTLIETLTEEERNDFKEQYREKETKYLTLFLLIENEIKEDNSPNDDIYTKIIKNKKELGEDTIDTTKEKIITFLQEKIISKTFEIRNKTQNLLNECEFFINRNLNFLAQTAWQKAKDLINENELYDLNQRLFDLQMRANFQNKSTDLETNIKEFAQLVTQFSASQDSTEQSVRQLGESENILAEVRKTSQELYEKFIKNIKKTKKIAIQEEIYLNFGQLLAMQIDIGVHKEGIALATNHEANFYKNWFYRLVFLYSVLHKKNNHCQDIFWQMEDILSFNPKSLLPEKEKNLPENAILPFDIYGNVWVKSWEVLMELEKIYISFLDANYQKTQANFMRLHIACTQLSHDSTIKYSAFGYFLARKLSNLEILLKIKTGENFENIKLITNTLPLDIENFSYLQITKLNLQYNFRSIILKSLVAYGNADKPLRQTIISEIRQILQGKELETLPTYYADLQLLSLFWQHLENNTDLESEVRNLKRFLIKNHLDKDFRKTFLEMISESLNKNIGLGILFFGQEANKAFKQKEIIGKKEILEQEAEKMNIFHQTILKVFVLSRKGI